MGSTLQTSYATWELNGKLASDFQYGTVRLTPSVAIFGGAGRNDQTLGQTFTQFNGGAFFRSGTYTAVTSLHWRDVGARAGLDASMPVNSWLSVDAGGYLGFAFRNVSLSGNDVSNFPTLATFNGASAISTSSNTTAFVANAEVGAKVKPWSAHDVTFRGFGGLNFDSQVAGISPTSFASYSVGTATTAAGISFQNKTNYYAGGGVIVRFAAAPSK